MKRTLMVGALALGLIAGGSNAGEAQVGPPGADMIQPGSLYGGAAGEVKYLRLPDYSINLRTVADDLPIYTYSDPSVFISGGDGMIGYVFMPGTLPAWLGENVRIEFAGGYRFGSRDHTEGNNLNVPPTLWYQLDGTPVGYGIGDTQVGDLNIEFKQWQIRLTVKSDIEVAPLFILTPSITVFGGRSETDFGEHNRVSLGAGFADAVLTEDIETTQIGVRFGAALAYVVTSHMRLVVGGYVGFSAMSSDYTGTNCQANQLQLSNCADPNAAFISNATDSSSDVAFIGGAHAGVRYSLGWVIVTVTGNVDYNSAVPGIRHPSAANPAPASIVTSGEFSFGGIVEIRVPFQP